MEHRANGEQTPSAKTSTVPTQGAAGHSSDGEKRTSPRPDVAVPPAPSSPPPAQPSPPPGQPSTAASPDIQDRMVVLDAIASDAAVAAAVLPVSGGESGNDQRRAEEMRTSDNISEQRQRQEQQQHQRHQLQHQQQPQQQQQQADLSTGASNNHLTVGTSPTAVQHRQNHPQQSSSPRSRSTTNRQRRASPSPAPHRMESDGRLEEARLPNPVTSEKRLRAHTCPSNTSSSCSGSGGDGNHDGILASNCTPQRGPSPGPTALSQPVSHGSPHSAPYNWQSSRTTIKARLQYMFNNEIMADVHFLVGKGPQAQRVPAHKFVLSISSAVFDAMFNGGMATMAEEVEIPDVEPAAFLSLLRFIYTDEVQIGPETVMTTLYTAKKYAVPALERACVEFLKRNLCSENAFMLLTQARLFDEPQLAALCLETIDKNTSEALNAEGFTDIDLATLCVVLERDTLGIRECKLFSAVCRWAGAETQRQSLPVAPEHQRAVLGRALNLIRFPLMTVEEFAVGPAQSGILTDREVVELFLHFTVNPKPSVNFLDTPRCCLTGKEQVVARFCQIESRWGYSGTSDRIRFMVNRRIFVVGFGLYGSIHGPSEYSVNIQVIHTDTGKVCGQNDTSFQCDGSTSTFRVMFKEPVEIQPNTNYTACATLKGPDSYYGTKGLRKVTHESLTSGKVTFQFTYAAGNNNGTSVEDGQLPEIIFYT